MSCASVNSYEGLWLPKFKNKLSVPNKLLIKKYKRIGRIGFLLQIKLLADQNDKYLELK